MLLLNLKIYIIIECKLKKRYRDQYDRNQEAKKKPHFKTTAEAYFIKCAFLESYLQ